MSIREDVKLKRVIKYVLPAIVPLIFISLFSCRAGREAVNWEAAQEIIKNITRPQFPDREFSVTDYGAVGNSITPCRQAFQKAVDACNQSGGGRVIVPAGNFYLDGPIHLKSNVHLVLNKDTRLEFSKHPQDYLPMVLTRWEGTELYNYSPFIYAYQAINVAITGRGVIDGNAADTFAKWKPHQKKDKKTLRQMGNDGVPVYQRLFGEGHFLRPVSIQFFSCVNVLVEGVTIVDMPFWIIHPLYCTNVTIRDITVDSWNPNNDGVDPDGSVNVLIENCTFRTGDDAIAIKSGRDQDGWRVGRPTENVVIRNCRMESKANGLCIGSEMSGSVRKIFMENCTVGNAGSTIYFKGNLDRGGIVENVYVRNITVQRARHAFIRFDSNYKGHRGNHFPPVFRNFTIQHVTCEQADQYGLYFKGVADEPISRVFLEDIIIKKAEFPVYSQYVKDIRVKSVIINNSALSKFPLNEVPVNDGKEMRW